MSNIKEDPRDQGILKKISRGFRAVQNTDALSQKRIRLFEIIKGLESAPNLGLERRAERILELKPLMDNFIFQSAGGSFPRSPQDAEVGELAKPLYDQGVKLRGLVEEYSHPDYGPADRLRVLNRLSEGLHRFFKLRDELGQQKGMTEGPAVGVKMPPRPKEL